MNTVYIRREVIFRYPNSRLEVLATNCPENPYIVRAGENEKGFPCRDEAFNFSMDLHKFFERAMFLS